MYIAEHLGVGRVQVGRWRARYAEEGLSGIERDLPRGGRRSTLDEQEIVRLRAQTLPDHATHWSTRTMAQVAGVGASTVRRVWQNVGRSTRMVSFAQPDPASAGFFVGFDENGDPEAAAFIHGIC